MTITPEEIEAEHAAAIAALTPAQHRALARLRNAKQATHFSGGHPSEALRNIFVREAAQRSEQLAEAAARAPQPATRERRRAA